MRECEKEQTISLHQLRTASVPGGATCDGRRDQSTVDPITAGACGSCQIARDHCPEVGGRRVECDGGWVRGGRGYLGAPYSEHLHPRKEGRPSACIFVICDAEGVLV